MPLPKLDLPTYTLELPASKQKIKYRPFLVKEERLLLMAMESKEEDEMKSAIEQIITNCTFDKIVPDDLPLVDIEYIFLWLRIKSKGKDAEYAFKCSECGVVNDKVADLTKVEVTNKDRDDIIHLTSDIGLKMKVPTYALTNTITTDMTSKDVFNVIIDSIESIFDGDEVHLAKDQSKEELSDFIDTLSSTQFKNIREYLENTPALELNVDFNCASCKTENKLMLRGIHDFLA